MPTKHPNPNALPARSHAEIRLGGFNSPTLGKPTSRGGFVVEMDAVPWRSFSARLRVASRDIRVSERVESEGVVFGGFEAELDFAEPPTDDHHSARDFLSEPLK